MKKQVLTWILARVAFASTHAETLNIDWRSWMFDHDATDLTDDSGDVGILNNYDVLWQLIHTDDAVPSAPDLTADNYLGAGESLVDEPRYLTGSSHAGFDMALFPTYDELFSTPTVDKATTTSYYVYQRIYELEPGQTAPQNGTWYYDSEVWNLVDLPQWEAGTDYYLSAMGDAAETYGVKPNQQVSMTTPIPEPATMSLLGLGALVLGLRRKLRK